MRKGESIQKYFTRVSQFKEQLEAIEDKIDEIELVMTALNGITRPWDSFIQTICARKESLKFDILWEECVQEETRVAKREALLREDDHALATYTRIRKGKHHFKKETHKGSYPPKKFQQNERGYYNKKYFSSYQCYHCDKIGHIARNCPKKKEEYKRKNKKRHHANLTEEKEEK